MGACVRSAVCLFLFSLASALPAQDPLHLTLRLEVAIARGELESVACLTRLPDAQRYQFLLHRGLNIKRIHDGSGTLLRYDGELGGRFIGEGALYTVLDGITPTDALCIEYVGALPVYHVDRGDYGTRDHKGAIAFNGRTVRASEQSKWYPILYDSTLGTRAYEAVTYDATVGCGDCRAIYLNGDEPKDGLAGSFRSEVAVPLLLFAGDFHTERVPGLTLLNGTSHTLSRRAVELLAGMVDSIRTQYELWLGIPYGQRLVFLQHTITENNPRRHWGFVTFPTIAFSNRGFTVFVDDSAGVVSPLLWPYLGHEMGHYYFGTLVRGRGPYFWFLVESLAEYLSLQVVRRFHGDSAYRATLATYARHAIADTTSVQFDRIAAAGQIHDRYRGEYAPLLLVALEDRAGVQAVRRLLTAILRQPSRAWDYSAIREAALTGGISDAVWRRFDEECVRPRFANGCLVRYAGQ